MAMSEFGQELRESIDGGQHFRQGDILAPRKERLEGVGVDCWLWWRPHNQLGRSLLPDMRILLA